MRGVLSVILPPMCAFGVTLPQLSKNPSPESASPLAAAREAASAFRTAADSCTDSCPCVSFQPSSSFFLSPHPWKAESKKLSWWCGIGSWWGDDECRASFLTSSMVLIAPATIGDLSTNAGVAEEGGTTRIRRQQGQGHRSHQSVRTRSHITCNRRPNMASHDPSQTGVPPCPALSPCESCLLAASIW